MRASAGVPVPALMPARAPSGTQAHGAQASPAATHCRRPHAVRSLSRSLRGVGRDARLFLAATAGMGLVIGIYDLTFALYLRALGFRADYIGLFSAAAALSSLLSSLPVGLLLARVGRRPVLLGAGALHALALLLLTALRDPAPLLAVAAVIGAAAGPYWAATAPALTDDTAPDARVRVFAVQSFLLWAMAAVGSALGGAVPEVAGRALGQPAAAAAPLRVALWLVAAAIGASTLPFVGLRARGGATDAGGRGTEQRVVDLALFARLLVPDALLALALGAMVLFLPLFFSVRYHIAPGGLGLIFALSNIVAAVATLAAPAVAARVGHTRALLGLLAVSVPLLGLVTYAPLLPVAVVALYAQGSARTMTEPLYASFAMARAPGAQRALLGSLYQMTWNVGFSLGPWLSGVLQARGGFGLAFGVAIACQALATALLALFFGRGPHADAAASRRAGIPETRSIGA